MPRTALGSARLERIRKQQRLDKTIDKWRIAVIDQALPKHMERIDVIMKKNFKRFEIRRGVLLRVIEEDGEKLRERSTGKKF